LFVSHNSQKVLFWQTVSIVEEGYLFYILEFKGPPTVISRQPEFRVQMPDLPSIISKSIKLERSHQKVPWSKLKETLLALPKDILQLEGTPVELSRRS
jgi:hypothetical protein